MKKTVFALLCSSVLLSGCVNEAVMKQMSEDCAKVGGQMSIGVGIFGPSVECEKED